MITCVGRCGWGLVAALLWAGIEGVRASDPNDFTPSPGAKWHDSFCTGGREIVLTGDFNGDRRSDLVALSGQQVLVLFASADGTHFEGPVNWDHHPLPPGAIPVAGDVDGDGTDDLVYFLRGSGAGEAADDVVALFCGRSGFATRVKLHDRFCVGDEIPALGDVDGDGKADLITFAPGGDGGETWVGLSRGRQPVEGTRVWGVKMLVPGAIPLVADFDGDHRADVATVVREARPDNRGEVFVSLSDGGRFGGMRPWHRHFCIGEEIPMAGDVDGDGRADLLTFVRGRPDAAKGDDDPAGDVYVALSGSDAEGRPCFGPGVRRHTYFGVGQELPLVGDFTGDRKADIAALVRDTVSGTSPLFGDVFVARSSFGTLPNWQARIESLKVVTPEDHGGDEPYFVLLGCRVRANDPHSAQAWISGFSGDGWPEDVEAGQTVSIPEAKGSLPIPGVAAITRSDLAAGRLPEVVSLMIIAMESDNTSWANIVRRAQEVTVRAREGLAAATREHPVRPASRLADLKAWTQAAAEACDRFSAMNLWTVGPNDEDDAIGSELSFYLAADPEVLSLLSLDPEYAGIQTPAERYWKLGRNPLRIHAYKGLHQTIDAKRAHWELQFRLRRTD